jgi:penicillin-binding protein 1A
VTASRRSWIKRLGVALLVLLGAALVAGGVTYAAVARELPDIGAPLKGRDQTTVIYDRNGEVIAKLFAEQNRTDVPLEKIPAELRQAVIATEDQRFYQHKGVDPLGILRALWVDVTRPNVLHGGSTITQQYVKVAIVTPERTLKRKVMEAMLAYRLEHKYTKDQILALYLNTIYFGHGAYGVEAAAQTYFGKHVSDLDLAECAMIAGVIKSPGRYSPFIDMEAAKQRRATVLSQMADLGFITQDAAHTASASDIRLAAHKGAGSVAPYFVEYVKQMLTEKYGADMVYRGGLTVKTTLDTAMQKAAEDAIASRLDREDDPSAALVAIDPATGEIRAMVGGRDFATQQFNVAVQGLRQPGSAFKPFVLVTALDKGISPEQTFECGPRTFTLPNGQTWKVTGAPGGRKGPMRLREATEKSVNSVYAALVLETGAEAVSETAKSMGITTPIKPVPAIALGGLDRGVSPLEMAAAYGTLANGGVRTTPHAITEVLDAKGKPLETAKPSSARAISAQVAYLATDILKGVISKGTGTAAKIGRPAAGKTGTTQQYRDAWFVGYTPDLVAAVWVGYPDAQREMLSVHGRKVTGGSFPAEIWAAFMKQALAKTPKRDFDRPPGLTTAKICLESGQLASEFCTQTASGLFLADHLPKKCEIHTQPTEIEVPNLAGMAKEEALALLKKLMLLFKVVERPSSTVPVGIVFDQSPKAGSVGTTQTVVTIVVSKGPEPNQPPQPSFTIAPANPRAGEAVTFDASGSTDDGTIVTYAWEFGDGSPIVNGKTVQHAYASPGTYTVTLWVTDDRGAAQSKTATVQVR